jgi:acetyl-CoA/propionyl-CoA carboxylase biotin carboxyl carrier protein
MFERVLVANRGEIALRIMRTLRALGIRAVGVYSDADRDARHVAVADEAIHVGPSPAAQSYLNVERIIEAARRTGAEALHPGYGFLSESTALAAACADAGLVFVGPSIEAIDVMGDKNRAKETVVRQGVRVVPGVSGVGLSDDDLAEAARTIGFPALIKPSAGGGGKGMHLVLGPRDVAPGIAAARREARAAFGNDDLLIERYIDRPRHLEVQILADSHGSIVHLGERECTLQRRHQKVIEEAPAPCLEDAHRIALCEQAIAAARACDYVNAGTVEFIVSGDRLDEPYFLEMNTRLQVEHPVTELVWRVDLVEQQLRVAAGERLAFSQSDLAAAGHAMEARIYAEDPRNDFLPTGGIVAALSEPVRATGVRIDSSLQVGFRVDSYYDAMVSKVIAWGSDREEARRRLARSLEATTVLGVTTNVSFLRSVLADHAVVAGAMDTGLVERIAASLPARLTPPEVAIAAALLDITGTVGPGPWERGGGWRIGEPAWIPWRAMDDSDSVVDVRVRVGDGWWDAETTDRSWRAKVHVRGDWLRLELDGATHDFTVASTDGALWLGACGETWSMTPCAGRPHEAAASEQSLTLVSPMPGTVVAVSTEVGAVVVEGQPLAIVEAMKMEHTVRAPQDSVVVDVAVCVGERVGLRDLLIVLRTTSQTESPK